jgi:hypothetical protein
VRILSNLVGEGASAPQVGAAVRLAWDDAAGASLPRFELLGKSEG